jgi:hypothetical protein
VQQRIAQGMPHNGRHWLPCMLGAVLIVHGTCSFQQVPHASPNWHPLLSGSPPEGIHN